MYSGVSLIQPLWFPVKVAELTSFGWLIQSVIYTGSLSKEVSKYIKVTCTCMINIYDRERKQRYDKTIRPYINNFPLFYHAHNVQYARLPVLKIISLIQRILSLQPLITQCVLCPHPLGWLKKTNLANSLTGIKHKRDQSFCSLAECTRFKAVTARCHQCQVRSQPKVAGCPDNRILQDRIKKHHCIAY